MIALVLSVVAALVSAASVYTSWRARRIARDLGGRYADAIGLIAAIALVEPSVAAPEVRAKCARLLDAHKVETTIHRTGGRVH